MKLKNIVLVLGGILLLAGCAAVSQRRATVVDGIIQNAALGVSGFTFKIPDGFEVYRPAAKNPAEYNELQCMAIRIYDLNNAWHPRGNELFYESFLLLSEKSCFLLTTLKSNEVGLPDRSPFTDELVMQQDLLPLYNVTDRRSFELNESRRPAVYTRGSAYERKGWYYAKPKRNGMLFNYEACKISDGNRDSYILMGFALPENSGDLAAPLRQMVEEMKFSTP